MQDDDDNQRLLERARSGDRGALETLLERHQASVYRFGLKMCRNSEDAKDVVQDTLLAAARGVRDFRGASSLSTWLYSIARSFCIKKRRKSRFAPHAEQSLETGAAAEVSALADPARRPDDAVADRQVELALETAIASLDPAYREVLLLRDVEGLTASEVAEVLDLNVAAVKSRLHRARLAVRASIAPLLGMPEAAAAPAGPCPNVLNLLSQHLEADIDAEVCARMEKHVEGCSRCRQACDSLRHTLSLCRNAGARVEVPPEVQASVKSALRELLERPP